jgi:hypothetical protein
MGRGCGFNVVTHVSTAKMVSGYHGVYSFVFGLSSWEGKLLSLGGRLVLINSVLTNMVLYMISFFLMPK